MTKHKGKKEGGRHRHILYSAIDRGLFSRCVAEREAMAYRPGSTRGAARRTCRQWRDEHLEKTRDWYLWSCWCLIFVWKTSTERVLQRTLSFPADGPVFRYMTDSPWCQQSSLNGPICLISVLDRMTTSVLKGNKRTQWWQTLLGGLANAQENVPDPASDGSPQDSGDDEEFYASDVALASF